MYFLLGKNSNLKTTCLLQVGYDILKSTNYSEDYVLFITSEESKETFKAHLMGKYNTISSETIENIHIKNFSNSIEIENFLLNFSLISEECYPIAIIIDRLNLFVKVKENNFQEKENYEKKLFSHYSEIVNIIDLFKKKIFFFISIEHPENQDEKDFYICLNALLCKSDGFYSFKESMTAEVSRLKLDFDPENEYLLKLTETKITKKKGKESMSKISGVQKLLELSLNSFQTNLNKYLTEHVDDLSYN